MFFFEGIFNQCFKIQARHQTSKNFSHGSTVLNSMNRVNNSEPKLPSLDENKCWTKVDYSEVDLVCFGCYLVLVG
jgi:hypothetical protein